MTKARSLVPVTALLAFATLPLMIAPAAGQQSDRAHQVGNRLKCMCGGCGDAAGKCYHVGGAFSGPCDTAKAMLKEIDDRMARGESDDLIVQAFVQKFGPEVYVEPPHSGFGRVAWAMPTVYLAIGTALVIFVIARWRKHAVEPVASPRSAPQISPELLERARAQAARDTED